MQLWSFTGARLLTLVIEEVMLVVLIEILGFPNMTVKLLAQFIVVSLNYVFSKLIVFRKKATPEEKKLDELDIMYEKQSRLNLRHRGLLKEKIHNAGKN